jgi:hypothetical protein
LITAPWLCQRTRRQSAIATVTMLRSRFTR